MANGPECDGEKRLKTSCEHEEGRFGGLARRERLRGVDDE